jgi:hypothetical protein
LRTALAAAVALSAGVLAAPPAQVQSRVDAYQRFTRILGVGPGGNLYC